MEKIKRFLPIEMTLLLENESLEDANFEPYT